MNRSVARDQFEEAFIKNFTTVSLGIIINYINGILVFTFFRNAVFYSDPRYILYIHLVINDMIMLCLAVALQVISYTTNLTVSVCCFLILITSTTTKNTPLNLAGMAIERYIAICKPLHHSQICTVRRTRFLIGLIWGVSVIPALADIFIVVAIRPLTFFSSTRMCYMLGIYNTPQHKAKATTVQVIYLSFVWMMLIYTYFRILYAAKAASTDQASAKKARNTILLHGVQLLLCMLSYITPIINISLMTLFPRNRSTILFSDFLLAHIFPRLLSPLIYGVRDQKFVKYIRAYLSCKLCAIKRGKVKPAQRILNLIHE